MMILPKFSLSVFLLCSLSSVGAFVPQSRIGINKHQDVVGSNLRPLRSSPEEKSDIPPPPKSSSSSSKEENDAMKKVDELLKKVDFSQGAEAAKELTNALTKVDTSLDLASLRRNILEGEVGTRGEEYALIQFFLIGCVLLGGVPIVGGLIMFLFGPGAIVLGLLICFLGLKDLGGSLSPWPTPAPGGTLVTTGIYEKIRHPIYAGLFAFLVGLSITTGSATRLVLTFILYYALNTKVDYEEELLLDKFGYMYTQYQQDVPGRYFPTDLLDDAPWNKEGSP